FNATRYGGRVWQMSGYPDKHNERLHGIEIEKAEMDFLRETSWLVRGVVQINGVTVRTRNAYERTDEVRDTMRARRRGPQKYLHAPIIFGNPEAGEFYDFSLDA
ncbi:MAG: hypothetical protein JWO07_121, partial [Candidatus Saccharibacteria bacterium]|nr:hypothetical protein [Candidatus Saccharibacteria bacterium]